MKTFITTFSLLGLAFTVSAATLVPAGQRISAADPHIQYVGRVNFNHPESPLFTYPGVQIKAVFSGTSLRMIAKPKSGYFMAQIDGAAPFKVAFTGEKDSVVTLATALPRGQHTVELMYAIEGYQRRPEFRGFLLDEGCRLADAPALPERKIEFIGNSITCGYGVESSDPNEHFSDETENHYYTYAAITARNLKAQHVAVARSGIGIYRNYGAPKAGSDDCMPRMYPYTNFLDKSQEWDFSRYQPDVVCVNLGTNDMSLNNCDPKRLLNGYRSFLRDLRGHYPKAKIVFLSGSMLHEKDLETVKKALDTTVEEAQARGDREVYRFDMTDQQGDIGYGADWHPSFWQQQKMAGELTAYLRALMKWF